MPSRPVVGVSLLLASALAVALTGPIPSAPANQGPARKKAPVEPKKRRARNLIGNEGPIVAQEPPATPVDRLKVKPGFNVELLYSVPKNIEGSWVSMCLGPKNDLIVCDQYGGLFRVVPAPLGAPADQTRVEKIPVDIGEAQGLLWAFDSLYVVVNRGQKYESGLYRVRDTNGDGELDQVQQLRKLKGAGEHGPHAVVLSPDGKSLTIVAGNATALTELADRRVPPTYGEDHLLPRMVDGNGFMRDELAPGGCVYRVSPDGQDWTLIAMGFRNQYDAAYNLDQELFTYDSDMEWDMNTPWYRPTRVYQVTSGADFGYRNGAGKFPSYVWDCLPPTINIGPGSPTGVAFGFGARFPERYQRAFYICDWSYGKLYAVHLRPDQSHYQAEAEEFITGTPLPLTDLVVNPADGAMYFTIGGRRTKSGLYRVTYTGTEPATPVTQPHREGTDLRELRRSVEAFHGRVDPRAVEVAWPLLSHPDRFIRYAARIALEFQPLETWREKAFAETNPTAALNALLAVVRASTPGPEHRRPTDPPVDTALRDRIIEALGKLDWNALDQTQRLNLLRVGTVAFDRMGRPDDGLVNSIVGHLDPLYPAKSPELNKELCDLLVYFQAPEATPRTIELLEHATTQEEQITYAMALRVMKAGWTPELRKRYFEWFHRAINFGGGASLGGFIKNIRNDAIATLTPAEKTELGPLLADLVRAGGQPAAALPPRPFVKEWSVDELAPIVEKGLAGRDLNKGRALFAATQCFACHRFANEGGAVGPDLTGVAGRFSPRDLLESLIVPSKTISDQYQAVVIATSDGQVITGRIVNLNNDNLSINTNMLDPNAQVSVDRKHIDEIKPSPVSMMPEGLLNTLHREEVLDLVAFLLSGNPAGIATAGGPSQP